MAFPSAAAMNRAQLKQQTQSNAIGNRIRASTFHLDLGDDISYVEHQNIDSDDDMQSEYSSTLPGEDIGRIESFHKDSDDMLRVRVRHHNATTTLPPTAEGVDEELESSSEDDCELVNTTLHKNLDDLCNESKAEASTLSKQGSSNYVDGMYEDDPDFAKLDKSKMGLSVSVPISIFAKKGNKVAWCGIRFGVWSEQGQKATQEDRTCTVSKLFRKGKTPTDLTNVFYSALFDGHGGEIVSEYLAENLHKCIVERSSFPDNLPKAIRNACISLDRKFIHTAATSILEHNKKVNAGEVRQSLLRTKADKRGTESTIEQYRKAGSTAAFVLISKQASSHQVTLERLKSLHKKSDDTATTDADAKAQDVLNSVATTGIQDNLRRILHVGWVGDSRVVLCRGGVAVQLSIDHKARREDEKQRIRDSGGTVDRNGRLNGVLAVSRAFGGLSHKAENLKLIENLGSEGKDSGDEALANGPLSSIPGIASHTLNQDDEFIILASDGLFDSISNQLVVNFVRRHLYYHNDSDKAAKALILKAIKDCGAVDNTTAVVIVLRT
uniref:PPM-type phosphatase domain-containing protein n=1 Tax=Aplanochytrium stocchinoi TaxID=215587 RepID=A0A7S3PIM9_9STRA